MWSYWVFSRLTNLTCEDVMRPDNVDDVMILRAIRCDDVMILKDKTL